MDSFLLGRCDELFGERRVEVVQLGGHWDRDLRTFVLISFGRWSWETSFFSDIFFSHFLTLEGFGGGVRGQHFSCKICFLGFCFCCCCCCWGRVSRGDGDNLVFFWGGKWQDFCTNFDGQNTIRTSDSFQLFVQARCWLAMWSFHPWSFLDCNGGMMLAARWNCRWELVEGFMFKDSLCTNISFKWFLFPSNDLTSRLRKNWTFGVWNTYCLFLRKKWCHF